MSLRSAQELHDGIIRLVNQYPTLSIFEVWGVLESAKCVFEPMQQHDEDEDEEAS
jgi:hypothetical protein